jgi:hypothetical protein
MMTMAGTARETTSFSTGAEVISSNLEFEVSDFEFDGSDREFAASWGTPSVD